MAKYTPVLWTSKINKKGKAPIYLRIEANNKRRYQSLRVMIRPSEWNERTRRVRKKHPEHQRINQLIAARIAELTSIELERVSERQHISPRTLKKALQPDEQPASSFFAFARQVIDDKEARGQIHTHKRYKTICVKFMAFTAPDLTFDEVTPLLLKRYETHLIQHYGNSPNTVITNFNGLRTIYYDAIRMGLVEQGKNPFFQFKPSKGEKTHRTKLSLAEIGRMEALQIEEGSLLWHVRNYFLFSFYCAGIRFGDLARLRWEALERHGTSLRLTYRMSKTGTVKSLGLVPPAEAIMERYVYRRNQAPAGYLFPMLDRYTVDTPRQMVIAISAQNALVNKYLKKLAKRAGIDKAVSFHIARHSFADLARRKGMDVYSISKALGHANLKVTETYLKGFDVTDLDQKMTALFS